MLKGWEIIVAGVLVLNSCGHDATDDSNIFRYNESAGIATLDPAFAKDQSIIWACNQLYNGLVELDEDLCVQPALAKSWEISEDGKTYTFHLRNNVYFHEDICFPNGTRQVVAQDFVYSFQRVLSPVVASPGMWIFSLVDSLNNRPYFTAPDDTTLIIKLKEPFAPFLGMLSMTYCSVLPKEAVEAYGKDFRKHPVGTGPFFLKLWKENVKLIFRKNPNYFQHDRLGIRLPYLDGVAITFITDKQSAFLEFVKGNLDFMSGIDPNYKDELLTHQGQLRTKYHNTLQLITQPYLNTEYLGFLMDTVDKQKNNPLLNIHVRQAINYGFDREKMIRYLRNGIGMPGSGGIIPKGLFGYNAEKNIGYDYNPVKAADLLAKAGYPKGEGLPTITLSTTASYLDLCKYIQQQLSLLGMDVKIDVNPPGALREMIAQSKTPWFRGSWIADYPDAENYLSLFYSPNHCPTGPNYTHFQSEVFDRLYEQARRETNDSLRAILYEDLDKLIMEQAPIVVLYYDQVIRFAGKNVKNLGSNAMNLLVLKNVRKE